MPKEKQKESLAYLALSMIQAIFREEKILKELPAEEREKRRQVSVRPLVEAYFEWLKENIRRIWSYVKKKYKLNMPFLRLAYPARASAFSSNAA